MNFRINPDDYRILGRPLKIFVAVPLRDDWRGVDRTIVQWIGYLSHGKHKIVSHVEEPVEPVEYARNLIVKRFLRTNCDALLMIDQDQRPQMSAAKLLDTNADIAAGFTLLKRVIPEGSEKRLGLAPPALREGRTIDPRLAGDQRVDSVGFGAVLIRRRVLEDRRLWLDPRYSDPFTGQVQSLADDPDEPPAIFQTLRKPNGRTLYSEDFYFCLRAHALGYQIAIQMDARFGHVKAVDFLQVAGFGDTEAGQPNGYVLCGTAEDMGG